MFLGMEISQVKHLKDLEKEASQYKKIVAERAPQITVLKDVIEKKALALAKSWTHRIFKTKISDEPSAGVYTVLYQNLSFLLPGKPKIDGDVIGEFPSWQSPPYMGLLMTYHCLRKFQYLWNHKRVYRI